MIKSSFDKSWGVQNNVKEKQRLYKVRRSLEKTGAEN
jgi:hypothetical protein